MLWSAVALVAVFLHSAEKRNSLEQPLVLSVQTQVSDRFTSTNYRCFLTLLAARLLRVDIHQTTGPLPVLAERATPPCAGRQGSGLGSAWEDVVLCWSCEGCGVVLELWGVWCCVGAWRLWPCDSSLHPPTSPSSTSSPMLSCGPACMCIPIYAYV